MKKKKETDNLSKSMKQIQKWGREGGEECATPRHSTAPHLRFVFQTQLMDARDLGAPWISSRGFDVSESYGLGKEIEGQVAG